MIVCDKILDWLAGSEAKQWRIYEFYAESGMREIHQFSDGCFFKEGDFCTQCSKCCWRDYDAAKVTKIPDVVETTSGASGVSGGKRRKLK